MNCSNSKEPARSRREMFRSTARYLALGGISLLSAGLIAKGTTSSAGGRCRRSFDCRNCAAVAYCQLPPALSARSANATDRQ